MYHLTESRSLRRAFTLVEMLVVVSLIAILVALLLPVLTKARDSARTVQCQSNMRSIGQAIAAYALANEDALVTSQASGLIPSNWVFWQPGRNVNQSALAPYLQKEDDALRDLFRCPSQPLENQVGFENGGRYPLTYTLNYTISQFPLLRWIGIKNPSQKIIVYDENANADDDIFYYGTDRDTLAGRHGSASSQVNNTNGSGSTITLRRMGSVLFCDDHVELADNDKCHSARYNDLSIP